MPYNVSKGVVVRNHRYLQDMAEAKRTLMWPSADPKRLAYRIREAMYATQYHDEFKGLVWLRDFYEIGVEQGAVRARWMGPEHEGEPFKRKGGLKRGQPSPPTNGKGYPLPPELGGYQSGAIPHDPPMGPLAVMELRDVTTLEGVVGAGIRFKEEAEEIKLPSAILGHDAKMKLWRWGQTSGWRFIDHEEDGITLTRKPVDEELLWSPPK